MNRFMKRLAVVPAAVLSFAVHLPPANAAACNSGTPFTGLATGNLASINTLDYWTTDSTGRTALTVVGADTGIHMHVWDESCTQISSCSSGNACVAEYTGILSITVHGGTGTYALTATDVGPTGVTPPPAGTCNLVNTTGVCANVSIGSEVQRVNVYEPVVGTAATHNVVGEIDRFRFDLPTGGSVVVPCVVLKVNATTSNGCDTAGGDFVDQYALLVDEPVNQPSVTLGSPLFSIGVCNGAYTITAGGFGVEDFPALTTC